MLISGFTIVKNAIKYDFPIVESIKSLLPICDEYIVSIGDSEDETEQLIDSINDSKIKKIKTNWLLNKKNTKMGEILKEKTDSALKECKGIWAFYLQADEVLHEKELSKIKDLAKKNEHNNNIDALAFKYYHFYGSYSNYIIDPKIIYPWAIRMIRNNSSFEAKGDACTFLKKRNIFGVRPRTKELLLESNIYHYGMVRPPEKQKERLINMYSYYKDLKWAQGNSEFFKAGNKFVYEENKSKYATFNGSHPSIMKDRINKYNENPI